MVCMVGDGGLAMTLAELETMARLRLPVTVVVFDDAALSLIEVKQKPGQGGAAAVRFAPVDYAQVAAAMGLESRRSSTTRRWRRRRRWRAGGTATTDRRPHRSGDIRPLIAATRG